MRKKGLRIAVIIIVCLLVVGFGGFYIYTLDYYRADADALALLSAQNISTDDKGDVIIVKAQKTLDNPVGLIFYPGGKVEATAYLPLLNKLSEHGITCVLLKMPFNLAVFDINAADRVYQKLPDIRTWYLAGHSLGGAMASSYVGSNAEKVNGLILLGAYLINDAKIATIAICGTEDKGLDKLKLEAADSKTEIAGGNHAYFGNYGEQRGDGTASITRDDQQKQAVEAMIDFILSTDPFGMQSTTE